MTETVETNLLDKSAANKEKPHNQLHDSPAPYILTRVSSSRSVSDILVIWGVLAVLLAAWRVEVELTVVGGVRNLVGDQDVREGSGLDLEGCSW